MRGQFYESERQMIPTFPIAAESDAQLHGGDLESVTAEFGHARAVWLDLSTGINPRPYPIPQLRAEHWHRLPSKSAEKQLLDAARAYYGLPDGAEICALPGTQAAIQLLPRLMALCEVAILSPTYNEHAANWRRAGHRVYEIGDLSKIPESAGIVILVHPNNPDGRQFPKASLLDLAVAMRQRNGWLIVDEAFADVTPDISLASDILPEGPIILRSFGKFFGLAGLRLGFLMAPPHFMAKVHQELGPWAVSGIALEIGARALADRNWITQTRAQLAVAARKLAELLGAAGLEISGHTDLFCLTESPESQALYRHLCERAILVRKFPERPNFLRFGLPGAEIGWQRLETALRDWANR